MAKNLYFIGSFNGDNSTTIDSYARRMPATHVGATTTTEMRAINQALAKAGFIPVAHGLRNAGAGFIQLWLREQKVLAKKAPFYESRGAQNTFCCGMQFNKVWTWRDGTPRLCLANKRLLLATSVMEGRRHLAPKPWPAFKIGRTLYRIYGLQGAAPGL